MAGLFTDLSEEIKRVYPKGSWDNMFNTMAPYRAMLRKCPYKPTKGSVYMPARLAGMWSIGVHADGADFPAAKDPTRKQFTLTPELFSGAFTLGLVAKETAVDQESTYVDGGVLADRVEETSEELAKYINKIYSGANRTRLAIVASDGSNNFVASQAAGTSNLGVLLLNENMTIEVRTAHASGSVRDSMENQKITTIDESSQTVTYAGSDRTLVAGDHVYIYGSYSQTPWALDDLVDDGNASDSVLGLSRTTYPRLKANILGNSGTLRDISEQLFMQACNAPRRRAGKNVDVIMANQGQSMKIAEFIGRDRRFITDPKAAPKYSMGYDEQSFRIFAPGVNAKYVENTDCQGRKIYCLHWDSFVHYSAMDLDWFDDGGGMLKPIPGSSNNYKAGVLAMMASIENQGNIMPIANSRIDDLKDPLFGDA